MKKVSFFLKKNSFAGKKRGYYRNSCWKEKSEMGNVWLKFVNIVQQPEFRQSNDQQIARFFKCAGLSAIAVWGRPNSRSLLKP
jgi:hypothetical protein